MEREENGGCPSLAASRLMYKTDSALQCTDRFHKNKQNLQFKFLILVSVNRGHVVRHRNVVFPHHACLYRYRPSHRSTKVCIPPTVQTLCTHRIKQQWFKWKTIEWNVDLTA